MEKELILLEAKEKGDLIRKTINESNIADNDGENDSEEINEIKDLIISSRTLLGDRWWSELTEK